MRIRSWPAPSWPSAPGWRSWSSSIGCPAAALPDRRRRALAWALLLLGLAGCVHTPAPVSERSGASAPAPRGSASARGEYRVREGDTLYSIAWRHGLDWRALARRNGIGPPWTIRAGQRLVLSGAAGPAGRAASGSATASPRAPTPAASAAPRWDWPLGGPVVRRFARSGATLNQGIDIRGSAGADVRAAAAGEIVYAGTGLRGFAQLVIVKHDDTWLSAYGLGDGIVVKEGQKLARGDRIARLEVEDGEAPLLHFEIRRNGDPVDPLGHLPAR